MPIIVRQFQPVYSLTADLSTPRSDNSYIIVRLFQPVYSLVAVEPLQQGDKLVPLQLLAYQLLDLKTHRHTLCLFI